MVSWLHSAQPMLAALLGGAAFFRGPSIGVLALIAVNHVTRTYAGLSEVLTGKVGLNEGPVCFKGRDVTALKAFQRARLGFGWTFQVARIVPEIDLHANVVVAVKVRAEVESILDRFGFARGRWHDDAGDLSHGDRKRLEFYIALAGRPEILMLDEPTAGMSSPDRREITRLLLRLKRETDIVLIMTEHDMDITFELADGLMALNYGSVVAVGDPETARRDPMVRDVYLGHEANHA